MYSDVFLTGTIQKIYDPSDGLVYAKVKSTRTIQTNGGPITTYANILLKQKEGYEQYVGKLEPNDLIFARGYLEANENGNPVIGNKGLPVFVLVPWTVRILGQIVDEPFNDEFSVTLFGYLGNDPDLRYMEDGTAVANVSLATSRSVKTPSGGNLKESTWWRVALWRRAAEVVAEYCHKGSRLLVVGSVNYDDQTHGPKTFTRRDETIGSSFEVTASSFTLADSKGESGPVRREQGIIDNEFEGGSSATEEDEEDDIPL